MMMMKLPILPCLTLTLACLYDLAELLMQLTSSVQKLVSDSLHFVCLVSVSEFPVAAAA